MNEKIITSTKKAYLFGSPVSHSISPNMQNLSFKQLGVDATYSAIDIGATQVDTIVDYIRANDFIGANVTMPLKSLVIPYLDGLSKESELTDSVNTIVRCKEGLIGYTTDGMGFIDSLGEIDVSIIDSDILILGCGGAAKSVTSALAINGAHTITIAKRLNNKMQAVVDFAKSLSDASNCSVNIIDIEDSSLLRDAVSSHDIIINATPIGMGDNQSLLPKSMLHPESVICDLIYKPEMTPLLRDAKAIGCKYMNGKYMLLYQGARSFKLWTGLDMPIADVKSKYFS